MICGNKNGGSVGLLSVLISNFRRMPMHLVSEYIACLR